MAYLVALVGFGWPWERAAKALRSRFPPHLIEFVGRDRPARWDARKFEYRNRVTADLVTRIFGKGDNASFCESDGACAIDSGKWSRANCRKSIKDSSACAKKRPEMLIVVCDPLAFELFFQKLGHAALFIKGGQNESIESLADLISSQLPNIETVKNYLANLTNTDYAPRVLPMNFQSKGHHAIAWSAQADLAEFCDVMRSYHAELYQANYQNPRKRYMRGAYMLDGRIGFQRDRLHAYAQLGAESRADGYHLLNAFHMYGFPVTPGYHFDISAADGNPIGHVFTDILSGYQSSPKATHVNMTPCDRLL